MDLAIGSLRLLYHIYTFYTIPKYDIIDLGYVL